MLTTSVAVVRKMLEAVAGSKPRRFSVSGTIAPEINAARDARADHGEEHYERKHHRVCRLLASGSDVHA